MHYIRSFPTYQDYWAYEYNIKKEKDIKLSKSFKIPIGLVKLIDHYTKVYCLDNRSIFLRNAINYVIDEFLPLIELIPNDND